MTAKTPRPAMAVTSAVLLTVAALLAAGCSAGQPAPAGTRFTAAATPSGSWPYPNGDLANTRDAAGSVISAANVSRLRAAWSFRLAGTAAAGVGESGSFAANPVVVDGTVYIQDLDANVYAVSLATGALKWEYQVNVPEKTGPGPDGVAVSGGLVYGDSSTSATVSNDLVFSTLYNGVLIALNRATGAIVYRHALPTSTNAPIAVAGNTVLVPAGAPVTSRTGSPGVPQLVAYTIS